MDIPFALTSGIARLAESAWRDGRGDAIVVRNAWLRRYTPLRGVRNDDVHLPISVQIDIPRIEIAVVPVHGIRETDETERIGSEGAVPVSSEDADGIGIFAYVQPIRLSVSVEIHEGAGARISVKHIDLLERATAGIEPNI